MATPYQDRPFEKPPINAGDEPYFAAAAEGKLLVKYCNACREYHHYPRVTCPFCGSKDVAWKDATGGGEVYSYSVTRRAGPIPYVMAYVKLDEGPIMMTNIVDCDLDTVRCGQRVKVVFKKSAEGDISIPCFKPAA